jgi:adenine-specific DNA-methyltransferase
MVSGAISTTRTRQGELGQFFTPAPIADFMASMFGPLPEHVRLLDAGAGTGALTAAFISRLCQRKDAVRVVDATLYEVDSTVQLALTETMVKCRDTCASAGIRFDFTIHATDFLEDISTRLSDDLFGGTPPEFDAAIVNPPYRKINAGSAERLHLRRAGIETSNLYTGFIALIQLLLAPGGQLVAITPRSFCNGPYFRPFRDEFLASLELRRLHVFESREAAFRADNVLQENIIFHAIKGRKQPRQTMVSSSSGENGDIVSSKAVPFTQIVHPGDPQCFIHIPSASSHATAKKFMDGLKSTLASLGVDVSTGRVVDFRVKSALRLQPEAGTVPLLYPCHFNGGSIHWPKTENRKPNALLDNDETRPSLVPSGVYLLTKRFTSKEEPRRLVACLVDPETLKTEWIGFENHLNYFHAGGRGLDRRLALGLFLFLNSTVADQYFRSFSGHTQVNATDLRALPYPERKTLEAMGDEVKDLSLSQEQIDSILENHLDGY